MKALLLQLPVQSHDYAYPAENIALGAGYLKAYAETVLSPEVTIVLAPQDIVNHGGDHAVVEWIVSQEPEVVGFSCYVWNVERSLAIARRVKDQCPRAVVVIGGPEVTPDNDFLSTTGGFDLGIVGEGERAFAETLLSLSSGMPASATIPGLLIPSDQRGFVANSSIPVNKLDSIPSPYLSGALTPSDAGTLMLETVRGCPNRCAYCYYHKRFPQVRLFSLDRVRRELEWAATRSVSEIYFVDPCFTRRKDLPALLEAITRARAIHPFTFQCECIAEDISPPLARSLAQAGLTQVEVGLQTINPRALARIGRRFHRRRFVDGIRALRGEGIRVMVDIMVGLPEDTLDDVKRCIDFVVDCDLFDELSVYTLSLLPGTELRRQATELQITWDPRPPYHVIRTPHMDPEDIRKAYEYAEAASGVDFFPPDIPDPLEPPEVRHIGSHVVAFPVEKTIQIFQASEAGPEPLPVLRFPSVGQAIVVYVSAHTVWCLEDPVVLEVFFRIFEKNPWTLLSFVVSLENPVFPWSVVFSVAERVQASRDHVLDRESFSTLDPVRSVQILARIPGPSGRTVLVRFPLAGWQESEKAPTGLKPPVDQAWVGLPDDLLPEEESSWLQDIWAFCPSHIFRLRLGDG